MTIAKMNRLVEQTLKMKDDCFAYAVDDMDLSEAMVGMIRERLFQGENTDGSEISPFYTLFTQNVKEAKGQPYDRVTLKDTGAFYESIKAEYDGADSVIFYATDEKLDDAGDMVNTLDEMLIPKYGEKIMGLTEEDKARVRDMTAKNIREWFFYRTGL